MKIFQKLLFLFLITWIGLFGITVYFVFRALNATAITLTDTAAGAVVSQVKPRLDPLLSRDILPALNAGTVRTARRALLQALDGNDLITDIWLVENERIRFSLRPGLRDSSFTPPGKRRAGNGGAGGNIRFWRQGGQVRAVWAVGKARQAVVILEPRARLVRSIVDGLALKLYLVGFGGLVVMGLLALVGHRVIRRPLARLEKALATIDRRRYGYRIKFSSDDEFAPTYEKANQALVRMEQLDAVQRAAVQKRNRLLKEMSTLSRFMDIMAHEIKNPLHALGINLDVLKTKIKKGSAPEAALKHAETVEEELDHLQEVVLGFLNYVRPGIPRRTRTDVNALIKTVCEMAAPEADRAKLRIETRLTKGLRRVLVDPSQAKQALHNVVINAIHATGEGGRIDIRTWSKKDRVFVEIKDTGAGISKEELQKVFDLYYTTKKGGSGLGLPVTRRIVELNGGQMQLESSVGKGTKITFAFPI